MKYLLLVYSNPRNWAHPTYQGTSGYLALSAEDRRKLDDQAQGLMKELTESGEFVVGSALADPAAATTARPGDGGSVMTDGPYQESKEQLAGYFVVDCETRQRAEEIAARFPDALYGAVEVRAIMDTAGQEM